MPTEVPPSSPPAILVIPPEGGRSATAFGSHAQFKLEGRHTGNALCLGISHTPPGAGPPPHVHHRDDEVFVVLEGELSFLTATGAQRLRAIAAEYGYEFLPPGALAASGSAPGGGSA
jgi:hypothetical protein